MKKIPIFFILIFLLNSCISLVNTYTPQYLPNQVFNKNIPITDTNLPIIINNFRIIGPNYVSGWDVQIWTINNSLETIKYITYSISAYNGVGDKVKCTIKDINIFNLQQVGPTNYKEYVSQTEIWKAVIYNGSIKDAKILKITIEYMNGNKITINSDEIDLLFFKKKK